VQADGREALRETGMRKNKGKRLMPFLNTYQVFFETFMQCSIGVMGLLLSVAAIWVAISANNISMKANTISESLLKIEEDRRTQELRPKILINEVERDGAWGYEIQNIGFEPEQLTIIYRPVLRIMHDTYRRLDDFSYIYLEGQARLADYDPLTGKAFVAIQSTNFHTRSEMHGFLLNMHGAVNRDIPSGTRFLTGLNMLGFFDVSYRQSPVTQDYSPWSNDYTNNFVDSVYEDRTGKTSIHLFNYQDKMITHEYFVVDEYGRSVYAFEPYFDDERNQPHLSNSPHYDSRGAGANIMNVSDLEAFSETIKDMILKEVMETNPNMFERLHGNQHPD